MVDSVVNPASVGQTIGEYSLAGQAKKIDDFTVDIMAPAEDAILPSRAVRMAIPAPSGLPACNFDASLNAAVGSGPYKLAEYTRGSHFLLKANPDYWGANKPTIAEIKIVFRNEATVRGSMLQAGEVQLAILLNPEQAKQLPASQIEVTGEVGRNPHQHRARPAQGRASAPGDQHVD